MSNPERTARSRSRHTQKCRAQRRFQMGTSDPMRRAILMQILVAAHLLLLMKLALAQDGGLRCGPKFDNQTKCPARFCCSILGGFCGQSAAYCDEGACDTGFGDCGPEYIIASGPGGTPVAPAGACGEIYGNCTGERCCSRSGFCGSNKDFCSLTEGCQAQYGKCGYSPGGLGAGAIVGIILGVIVGVIVFACIIIVAVRWFKRRKSPVTQYTLRQVSEATNGFNPSNRLGEGAYGEVYKGTLNGKEVAVKKMTLNSEAKEKDFKAEVQFRRQHLSHRNLMEVIGFCVRHEVGCLIYEYMHNRSLSQWLFPSDYDRGENVYDLPWAKRFDIAKGVADALIYLHHKLGGKIRRIVHGDIKPDNILLTSGLVPKLADFGMAKLIMSNEDIAQGNAGEDQVRGSPGYRPPEKHLGPEADVFSFGIVVLELLSGRRAFGESEGRLTHYLPLVALHCVRRVPEDLSILVDPLLLPIEHTNDSLHEEVKRVIRVALWCLQVDPKDRPNMMQVRDLLEDYTIKDSRFQGLPPISSRIETMLSEHGRQEASDHYTFMQSKQNSRSTSSRQPMIIEV